MQQKTKRKFNPADYLTREGLFAHPLYREMYPQILALVRDQDKDEAAALAMKRYRSIMADSNRTLAERLKASNAVLDDALAARRERSRGTGSGRQAQSGSGVQE